MEPVPALQLAALALLNLGFCWLAGSWLARRWLGIAGGAGVARLHGADLVASTGALLAAIAGVWAATAVMSGLPLLDARAMVWTMLSATDYGHAACAAVLTLGLAVLLRVPARTAPWREWAVLAALVVFAWLRAAMGHAGEAGWFSAPLVAEALHYAAIAAWTGMVLVAGWLVLARPSRLPNAVLHGYVHRMSRWAGCAVAVIAATGIYSAWHRIGAVANLTEGDYGVTLLAKLALVAAALLLGVYNKFIGLPALAGHEQSLAAVRTVLRVESAFLAAALVAASYLTTLQPPAGNLS